MKKIYSNLFEFLILLLIWRLLLYGFALIISLFQWQRTINPLLLSIFFSIISLIIVIIISKIYHTRSK